MIHSTSILLNKTFVPSPKCEISTMPLRLGCPFCKWPSNKKTFGSLWALYKHFCLDHKDALDRAQFLETARCLHKLILSGVLK